MNKCILIGRLTRDCDTRYTTGNNQMAISRFTLAVDRAIKKEGEADADFISCIAFGKTAEFCEKYLAKGTKIALEGRWQTGSYTNKDGVKVYTNDCVVERMEFAESKKSEKEQTPPPASDGFINVSEGINEDLPFAHPNR